MNPILFLINSLKYVKQKSLTFNTKYDRLIMLNNKLNEFQSYKHKLITN